MTTTDQILQGIRENRKAVEANAAAREKAAQALSSVDAEIAKHRTALPENPHSRIQREREDFQAGLLVGTATLDELASFERNAEKETKAFEAETRKSKAPPHLEAAQAGLKRRIVSLTAEHEALLAQGKMLLGDLLRAEAEERGAEYAAHGGRAFDAMLRVLNLGALLHRLEGRPSALAVGFREFCIPPLNTESTRLPATDEVRIGIDTNLFSVASDRNLAKHSDPIEAELLAELERSGIDVSLIRPPAPRPALVPPPAPEPQPEPGAENVKRRSILGGEPIRVDGGWEDPERFPDGHRRPESAVDGDDDGAA